MVKNIVLTGGFGYVGGRIARFLLDSGNNVTLTSRKKYDSTLLPGAKRLIIDAVNDDLEFYLRDIDAVIHLAAMNEIDCVLKPHEAIEVNISQTLRWLEASEKAGVKQFIYFSTFHVYGLGSGNIDEKVLPRPNHPYSITHRAAEDYVLASRMKNKLNGIVLRLSNAFGAPELPDVNRWTLLVNDLCREVVQTQTLSLQSDGTQERDFITLTDVCRAVGHLLNLNISDTLDGVFNLCGAETMQVYAMAEKIAGRYYLLYGKKPLINRPAPGVAWKQSLFCSNEKLKNTGFAFKNDLNAELDNMLEFCTRHFGKIHD
ncbi:MAG: SDR family oxidoreductase [Bacteroidetes bacterium]|nr:SDR family oxidoreductase [Bacteroidota bacterium]